jgi:hypothetical protein
LLEVNQQEVQKKKENESNRRTISTFRSNRSVSAIA